MRNVNYTYEPLNEGPRSLARLADHHGSPDRPGFDDGQVTQDEVNALLRDGKFQPDPYGMNLVTYDKDIVAKTIEQLGVGPARGAEYAQYAFARAASLFEAMAVSSAQYAASMTLSPIDSRAMFHFVRYGFT